MERHIGQSRAPARASYGGAEYAFAPASRRAGDGRARLPSRRALQFPCGKCGRGTQRGKHPPAMDEIAAAPGEPAGRSTRFGGNCRGRAQRCLFAVEDFSLAAGKLSVEEQEGIVDAKLRSRGLRLLSDRATRAGLAYWTTVMPEATCHPSSCITPRPICRRFPTSSNRKSRPVATIPQSWALVPATQAGFSKYRLAILLFE